MAISRKVLKLCLVLALGFSVFNVNNIKAHAVPIVLPEILDGWRVEDVKVTPLQATSGNLGQWTQCVYRQSDPNGRQDSLEVILMEGTGPGVLRVPEHEQDYRHEQGNGLFDGDTEYKTLTVAGHRAILEHHKLLPLALAVSVSPDVTLTIEGYADSDESILVKFAEEFITCITGSNK